MTLSKVSVETEVDGEDIYHKVRDLPKFQELSRHVKEIVSTSSYWERHGIDLLEIGLAVPLYILGLVLCNTDSVPIFLFGLFVLGLSHCTIANRAGHLAAHNAMFDTPWLNYVVRKFAIEFYAFFSLKAAMRIHIGEHHPYTNIIGRGDSSSWKAPMLPRFIYMFAAPVAVPILAPVVSVQELRSEVKEMVAFIINFSIGLTVNLYLIMALSGFTSIFSATIFLFTIRAILSFSYIHINIFQHIGLPMYKLESRPAKVYQMSTGVLNLHSNVLLNWVMGHSLISCHIEHHFFPALSDNMCLKVRPAVKKFLLDCGLPYHERPYMERLSVFLEKYEELMVKAPPISHFVGLQ